MIRLQPIYTRPYHRFPSTTFFISDSAVLLALCEVFAVIDWIVFMVEVMLVAAADCCCEALEIPSMRSARLVDTLSISPSAVPASSARRAPATTSDVVCSIELTASLVSDWRSEEHTSELQSLMRISYAVFCLKKKKNIIT